MHFISLSDRLVSGPVARLIVLNTKFYQGDETMGAQEEKTHHHARMASATPGRLRIKLHPSHRTPQVMNGIKRGLDFQEGVHDVRLNSSTGSVTVKYDRHHHDTESILGVLEDLDVLVQSLGHVPDIKRSAPGADGMDRSKGFLAAIEDLNQQIHGATGLPIDLKLILPLAFAGAGLWSISKRGLMVESVPGWLFLWFAFDMFVKLHPAQD